ncbi:hypothetical protein M5689_005894 [Euphorbia peplus]|nr:hypothetical protein M5689_005894 [Euphorbia peplus]
MALLVLFIVFTIFSIHSSANNAQSNPCRSYCGNITIDYPFALRYGCGHPGFRDLLFCINDLLMFHITSGTYRVLEIDYTYKTLTLHEPHLSTCDTITLGGKGNGFVVESWRSPYFSPVPDNVFMLIGCSAQSPLFQGFPAKHLPCRNVSGMGCEEYYGCPAWNMVGNRRAAGFNFGSGPPECCAVAFEAIKAINLSKLECEGYSSAYTLAPLRNNGASEWAYGIRVRYSVQGNEDLCRACEATGGTCGYGSDGVRQLCMCAHFNSTSNCDSVSSEISKSNCRTCNRMGLLAGSLVGILAWMAVNP